MSFTRIDCDIFRGTFSKRATSSYSVFNPCHKPGSIAFAGASAVRESLGSQLACTLSIERFCEGVLSYYWDEERERNEHTSEAVLERAFKQSNAAVYNFAHKMAAGGKMEASVLGTVLDGSTIAAGRIGNWSAYLARQNYLYPFFEERSPSATDVFLGGNSQVNVETTYVPLEPQDTFFAFSTLLTKPEEQRLLELLPELQSEIPQISRHISEYVFDDPEALDFSFCGKIGPESIYLKEAM